VVATDAIWTLGDGFGPGIAGSLVERGGYEQLAGLGGVTGLICMAVMLGVLQRLGRHENGPAPEEASPGDEQPL